MEKGVQIMAHNPRLADQQGLDQLSRDIIDNLHNYRSLLENEVNFHNTDLTQKELYDLWFSNEKLLQKLWKFDDNEDYIKFWNFPACTCPKMDNNDNYPHGRYVRVQTCPIHGWE
jgi:hypothetical protein